MVTDGKGNYNYPLYACKNRESFACDEKRYHILLIESGSGRITYGGHKELFMAPLLFCFNENEIPTIEEGKGIVSRSVYFNPEFVNNRLTFHNLNHPPEDFTLTDIREKHWFRSFFERTENYCGRIGLNITTVKRLSILFDKIIDQLETQPDYYWSCRSRSFLIETLMLIDQSWVIEDKNNSLFTSGYSEEVEKIILYLYSNYTDKITLPDIVAEFNINRTTLANKFKEEVGDSIINSLINLRINVASSLLRDTLIPISEVTYRVGFSDISHFNRTFKKHTGFNPSDYRQTYNIILNT